MEKNNNFRSLGLSENILKSISKKGFEEPTPIKRHVIPLLLESTIDIIGQAQTGTGKTAAFGLPMLEKIDLFIKDIQVLILTPTRELAIQVAEELLSFKSDENLKVLPIYGGQSIEMQIEHIKRNPQIIVGTPGRILDHLRRKTIKLKNLKFCVLDEADEMLN